ncbi:hypothetical protein GCM10010399_33930 [Dactylosporangium fulvum]|uniref:Endonuclease domain-containing protein n=1 Tax=Dactylosporangium fulvum TaxID=53359 RepID=A0ABY5W169_9ACTN|nr:endonuclease domain-containing protein [Dactylosporangium fulvum]UWP83199.1 endonuclease domain-containing protein [Dactylosporangium fulvum]
MAQSWADLPLDRPISIDGVSADSLALLIEPLPSDAPAIVTYNALPQPRAARIVATLLTELDRVARELFPAWLPKAAHIDSAAGAGVVAVRSIALRAAQNGGQYGPFLADLAERSLLQHVDATGPFDPEVRAVGLAKAIAAAFGRTRAAILIRVGEGFSVDQQQALIVAARWLSDSGRFGIWFTGTVLQVADAMEVVRFTPPTGEALPEFNAAYIDEPPLDEIVGYPAIAGQPHPGSRAEQLLEAALAPAAWAAGREWNQSYQPHPLTNPIRLDLLWRDARLVVEIDGVEHCDPARFAADRQRDVLLQLDGYAVLRFTNQQVLMHRDLVLAQIQQFLAGRRAGTHKGAMHAGPEAVTAGAGAPAHPDGGEH